MSRGRSAQQDDGTEGDERENDRAPLFCLFIDDFVKYEILGKKMKNTKLTTFVNNGFNIFYYKKFKFKSLNQQLI